MTVTHQQCKTKYGEASDKNPNLILWDVPPELELGILPNKLFCNKDLVGPASAAFAALIQTGALADLLTFDGCFNIRFARGLKVPSLHSWAIALDFDAFRNKLGARPTMTSRVVKCFTDNGFEWGGNWVRRPDGMHFQLAVI